MSTLADTFVTITDLGSATFGGATFAFSGFVMRALDRSPARAAVLTMQQINLSAARPPLVTVMVGTTLLSLVVGAISVVSLLGGEDVLASVLATAGCLGFLASIAITGRFHIPRNNAFADVDADSPGAADVWRAFSEPWQRGNHVRTAAALPGAGLLFVSLLV